MADGKHQVQLAGGPVTAVATNGPGNAVLPDTDSTSGRMLTEAMKGPSGPAPSLQDQAQPKR